MLPEPYVIQPNAQFFCLHSRPFPSAFSWNVPREILPTVHQDRNPNTASQPNVLLLWWLLTWTFTVGTVFPGHILTCLSWDQFRNCHPWENDFYSRAWISTLFLLWYQKYRDKFSREWWLAPWLVVTSVCMKHEKIIQLGLSVCLFLIHALGVTLVSSKRWGKSVWLQIMTAGSQGDGSEVSNLWLCSSVVGVNKHQPLSMSESSIVSAWSVTAHSFLR